LPLYIFIRPKDPSPTPTARSWKPSVLPEASGVLVTTPGPQSGRPDSNRRTSATQTRRSTRLSYAPVAASMAAATTHGVCPPTALARVETHQVEEVPA
jgi:hypothetical protein